MTRIRHVETLVYCDGPQVFEARDAIGGHYIAVLGPQEEARYLVAGVSPPELDAFRSGRTDLLDLLTGSDADSRYTTTSMPFDPDDELVVEPFDGSLQGSGFLPRPGFVLESPSLAPQAVEDAGENLCLELSLASISRIATSMYTELLGRVQTLVKRAAVAATREGGAGRSPIRRRDDWFEVVVPASAGSFRVQLEAANQRDPYFNTTMAAALRRIDRLFRDSADTEEVLRIARKNPRQMTWAYLKLLRLLADNETSLSYTWSRRRGSRSYGGAVSGVQAKTLVEALDKERAGDDTVVLEGELYRCNSGTGYWGLELDGSRHRVRGRVKSGLELSLAGLNVGGRYRFACEMDYAFGPASSGLDGQPYLIDYELLPPKEDDVSTVWYRRRGGGDMWHFCRNCSAWPRSNYEATRTKPGYGTFCVECQAKRAAGDCSGVPPAEPPPRRGRRRNVVED